MGRLLQIVSMSMFFFSNAVEVEITSRGAVVGLDASMSKTTPRKAVVREATLEENACVPHGMRAVPVHNGAFSMVVLGDDDIVSASLAKTGEWEVPSPAAMASKARTSIPTDGVLLDIGANIGYYTLMFASQGHRVIAVEPMTRNRRALEGSLCLNPDFKKLVTVVPAALVAPNEVAGMHCVVQSTNSQINIGNGYLTCTGADTYKPCGTGDANCEEVPVKTLDMLLTEVAPSSIDVVKMDVEAYECKVLEGGQSLFKTFNPHLLQIETAFGDSSKCVHNAAAEYGYDALTDGADTRLVHHGEQGKKVLVSLVQRTSS